MKECDFLLKKKSKVHLLHISLRQREKEVVLFVGFFKDAERDGQQERTEPKITFFFQKREKLKNPFARERHTKVWFVTKF